MDSQSDSFAFERQRMVDGQLRARGIQDEGLLQAMARVPRHEFVLDDYKRQSYEDHPIPIGEGQTISQPYIVAVTLEALQLDPIDTVLEIGTGSGYQTAILAHMAKQVYSIERHPALARRAENILRGLGYENVRIVVGDGSHGLPAAAPFDAIVVSAAAPQVPGSLFEQLREGGRMVIPIGPAQAQQLQLVIKRAGSPVVTVLEGCRFVPLIGEEGYPGDW